MKKCTKCGAEYDEQTTHVCATPPAPDPAPPAPAECDCPECGAKFTGRTISKKSEKLAALAEEKAALTRELAEEKAKHPAPDPAPDPPAPAKPKRRMIFGESKKRAA
jgi:hypothetical protein